jgi:hypothetical protein
VRACVRACVSPISQQRLIQTRPRPCLTHTLACSSSSLTQKNSIISRAEVAAARGRAVSSAQGQGRERVSESCEGGDASLGGCLNAEQITFFNDAIAAFRLQSLQMPTQLPNDVYPEA